MRQWVWGMLVAVGLMVGPTEPAGASWDASMAEYATRSDSVRLFIVSGYLGMYEAMESTLPAERQTQCGQLTIATIKETIEQWYRTGKLDPTEMLSTAVFHAVGTLCTVPNSRPSSSRKPGA